MIVYELENASHINELIKQNNYSKIIFLSDTNTVDKCVPNIVSTLETNLTIEIIEIEPGEIHKNINTCIQLWELLLEFEVDKKGLIINVGGGVITDLGGFVASTYKRGIDFIHVPSTLLAMVDAAIGGKNGIDFGFAKNQIGTINPPKLVWIIPDLLDTLPQNHWKAGLAEMFKHGLIFDKNHWEKLKQLDLYKKSDIGELIRESAQIKQSIVNQDPFEKNIRKSLNFGHTIGHALESYSHEKTELTTLLHGEAIAVGMLIESHISLQRKLISQEEFAEIHYIISEYFEFIDWNKQDFDAAMQYIYLDKKNEHQKVLMALIDGIGSCRINQELNENELSLSYDFFMKK